MPRRIIMDATRCPIHTGVFGLDFAYLSGNTGVSARSNLPIRPICAEVGHSPINSLLDPVRWFAE